jgi:hypothetical protein
MPPAARAEFINESLPRDAYPLLSRRTGSADLFCRSAAFPCPQGTSRGPTEQVRATLAFSKKWVNLKAALALHFAWYNYCKFHRTLRSTPAMAAGITDHIWSISELLGVVA